MVSKSWFPFLSTQEEIYLQSRFFLVCKSSLLSSSPLLMWGISDIRFRVARWGLSDPPGLTARGGACMVLCIWKEHWTRHLEASVPRPTLYDQELTRPL